MRTCQSCGRENPPDRDFCECGEYLRWEATGVVQAVTPEVLQAATDAAPAHGPAEAGAAPSAPAPPAPAAPAPAAPAAPAAARPAPPPGAHVAPATPVRPPGPGNGQPTAAPSPRVAKTAMQHAVQPAAPAAAPAQEPDTATIVLRLPDGESANEGALAISVEPGQRERVLALVRNQSGIVDNYELAVEGIPEDWFTIFPDTVYLVPFGTGGTYEQEVEVHLHPPRSPEAESRVWDLKVVAESKAYGRRAASAPLAMGIQPYVETSTRVRPERAKGRRKAIFDVSVDNTANAPVLVALEGEDPDGEMDFAFNRPPQEIGPGGAVTVGMRVKPPRQLWVGRATDHRLQVKTLTGEAAEERLAAEPLPPEALTEQPAEAPKRGLFHRRPRMAGSYGPRIYKPQVRPPGVGIGPGGVRLQKGALQAPRVQAPRVPSKQLKPGEIKLPGRGGPATPAVPLLPSQAIFRQKPWLGWWVLPLLLLLVIAAVIIYLLLPRNVVVPNIVGKKSAFEAEKVLTTAGLGLDPQQKQQVSKDKPPGSVLAQTPAAGQKAKKDSAVTILVAVGTGTVSVPSIVGLTAADADKALRAKDLTLGQATPQPVDPAGKISSQIPNAGEAVKVGTPVNIFYKAPAKPDKVKGKNAKEQAKKAAAAAAKGGAVPAVAAGATAAAVAAQVADKGLVPKTRNEFSAAKPGTVFGTDPPAGTQLKAGETLTLLVSGGFPELAFDNGSDILLVNGANGKKLDPIAKGPQKEAHPTWSPDGSHVAYVADNRIFLKDMTKPKDPSIPLSPPGDKYSDLAWAPTADINLLAMSQLKSPTERDLCLGQITKDGIAIKCKPQDDLTIGRNIHWSPDGKSILAFGVKPSKAENGIVRYRSKKPFSPDPGDWSKPRFITDVSKPGKGVIDAAISPDGKTLAVLSNFGADFFRLYLTKPGDFLLSNAKPTPVPGCKLTWRPDSKELAVVQADAGCTQETGSLTRVPVDNPQAGNQLNASGDDPAFQPLTLGG